MSAVNKIICSKCFNIIQNDNLVKCNTCRLMYHKVCANITCENDYKAIKNNKNIIFNCDNCISSSRDLIRTISTLTHEVNNLKLMVIDIAKKLNHNNEDLISQSSNIGVNVQNSNQNMYDQQSLRNPILSSDSPDTLQDNDVNAITIAEIQRVSNCSASVISHNDDAAGGSQRSLKQSSKMKKNAQTQSNIHTNTIFNNSSSQLTNMEDVNAGDLNLAPTTSGALANQNSVNSLEWVNVTKKKNRNKKRNIVVGQNDNEELDVIIRRKFVHLSSFKPCVTEEKIMSYVEKHLGVSKDCLVCFKLVKKDTDIDTLKKINFKLGISADSYSKLFTPSLWPSNVTVRPFRNVQKNRTTPALI